MKETSEKAFNDLELGTNHLKEEKNKKKRKVETEEIDVIELFGSHNIKTKSHQIKKKKRGDIQH